jgi:hypothetical protein
LKLSHLLEDIRQFFACCGEKDEQKFDLLLNIFRSLVINQKPVQVFIDTCSYLKSDPKLLLEMIKEHEMKLILPMIIFKEINNLKDNSKDANVKTQSKKVLFMIETLTDLKLIYFDKENNQPFHSEKFVDNDDIFIGCVAFYYGEKKSNIFVVSNDTGVRSQAKQFFESAKVCSIEEFQLMNK